MTNEVFFFQAEDGIRGGHVTGVQTCALPIFARHLEQWGLLPGTAAESLSPEGQWHRRWMVHGTSHHLGLDVHDCAQARREMYLDAELEPGIDRKSTRLNSSHVAISYAVFCLKKKNVS